MAPSTLRYAAFGAMASCAYGLIHQMPSPTIGIGMPLIDVMPTEAPSIELMRKNLVKRALTNTCSEWTILGLQGGTPICGASNTCLFTTAADGGLYEGCAQTSIPYNWVTFCSPWPQEATGTAPDSEIWCPSTAPACGYYAFEFDAESTFYNYGCSFTSYFYTATLVKAAVSTIVSLPHTPTVTTTAQSTVTTSPTTTSTPKLVPTINPPIHSKTPVAPIVGGVVGGIAVVAFAIFMTWFCIRRRNHQNSSHPPSSQIQSGPSAATAYHSQPNQYQNSHNMSELGGNGMQKPPSAIIAPVAGVYATHNHNEKPSLNTNTQNFYRPAHSLNGSELASDGISTQSPPPQYATPSTPGSPPMNTYSPSNFTELGTGGRQSVPPVSPITGTYSSANRASELATERRQSLRPVSPLAGTGTYSRINSAELPSMQQAPQQQLPHQNYNSYLPNQNLVNGGVQEMPGASYVSYPPNQVSPGVQEISGTGGIARLERQVRMGGVDMSGAPLGEDWEHH